MGDSPPTSRDIADAAGVSQATVSRALRNSPLVRPETRERIQRIARELNYSVNRNAAGLRTQQSKTIALLLFDETSGEQPQINPFFLSMLGSITSSAAALGYDVLVSFQQASNDWHIEYQVSNRADGIILLGYGDDFLSYRKKITALHDSGTHFIIWGPMVHEHPGHSLGCDNVSGGYQAAAHLARLGRRKIAFFGLVSERSPEHMSRYRGYQKALREANLPEIPGLVVQTDSHEEFGYQAAESLLDSGEDFDAIFAVTDVIAIGAMRALRDRGVRVPDDVALVVTTVRQDVEAAGALLVSMLVASINGESVASDLILPTLAIRESCGATA
jgi:DNA-binding LacI/PurR family transcriptional regulator